MTDNAKTKKGLEKLIRFSYHKKPVLIKKLIEFGVDFDSKETLKNLFGWVGVSEKKIEEFYIDFKNELYKKGFKKIPFNERVLFIPQCLRDSKKCKAELTDSGYICNDCSPCKAHRIKEIGEKLGYKVFIVPGGTMVVNIIKKEKPKAIMGIACYRELLDGVIALKKINIPGMGVLLSKTGCKDTDVSLEKVKGILKL